MSGRASLRDDASIGPYRLIFKAIPHNSKCRYGERGAAAAKPKAQIILGCCKGERRQWRKQRTEAGAAVTECEGLLPPKHDAGTATRHYRAFWQRRCRAAAAGAVLKPSSGNCAVLPLFLFPLPVQSGTAGRCRGQVSALRCRWLFCCAGLWGGRSCRQSSSNRCSAAG